MQSNALARQGMGGKGVESSPCLIVRQTGQNYRTPSVEVYVKMFSDDLLA